MVYVLMKFSKNSYKSLIRVFSTLNLQLCAWNMFRIQIFYQFYLFFNVEFIVCIEKKQKKPFTYGQIICSPLHPICKFFITYKLLMITSIFFADSEVCLIWFYNTKNLFIFLPDVIYYIQLLNSWCIIISYCVKSFFYSYKTKYIILQFI